ncbi:hypothetical protein L7F22_035552 [Adiantum nelumboides]|nr:hypothetical protein [Adiantum nelumboides]
MRALRKFVKRRPAIPTQKALCYLQSGEHGKYMVFCTQSEGNPPDPPEGEPTDPSNANPALPGGPDWEKLEKTVREWGELRKTRLTASCFGFAIGFWEGRRVQLWREKVGLLEPFSGNLATNWGTMKEATAIQRYVELTNNKVTHQLFKSYPLGTSLPDWLGCSPDGLVNTKWPLLLDNGGILEVKCPFNGGQPQVGVPWSYVPYYYMPQAQGLMEIFDRNWLDFYVWTMNGSSIYRIDRNPDLWELMLTALNDFWWVHVTPAIRLRSKDPNADLKRFKPGPHHALYLTIANKCRKLAERAPLLLNDQQPRLVRR